MSKATTKQVEREVRAVEQRLRGIESVQVMMHRVQVESLKQAEKLRKLANAVVTSEVKMAVGGGRTANVGKKRLVALTTFLRDLEPFYKNPGPMPAAMKQLLARHRKAGR